MAVLFYVLCTSIFKLASSYTLIPSATGLWEDDFSYTATAASLSDASESWWYDVSYGSGQDLDGTSTLPDGTAAHGWFRNVGTDAYDKIGRDFACPYYSNVEVIFHAYFCVNGNGGGDTTIYYFRTDLGLVIDLQFDRTASDHDGWYDVSGGNGICGKTVREASITDTFTVFPTDKFSIAINKVIENGGDNDNIVAAFSIESITCTQIPTPAPTEAPTAFTGQPSQTPSKSPSKTPSGAPSEAPSNNPSETPTSAPTKKPTVSWEPTTTPTKNPSAAPSTSPTLRPTEAPTKKPTERPTAQPTESPTVRVGFGSQIGFAFGAGTDPNCQEGESWVECNNAVFIILICFVVFAICYWILGAVWFKRRQNNRPDPATLVKADSTVEMGGDTHTTSDKWKSAWEMEKDQQNADQ